MRAPFSFNPPHRTQDTKKKACRVASPWGAFEQFAQGAVTLTETVLDSVVIIELTVPPKTSKPAMATTATRASNSANSTSDCAVCVRD